VNVKIRDSIAFVSGANRGLGLSFARELLARGAGKVYAGVRSAGSMRTNIARIVPIQLDVSDADSVAAAAVQCSDVNLLVNNAGIARVMQSTLDSGWIDTARELFETNFYGLVLMTQAFAPVLAKHGGAAIINVLSDTSWFSRPMLSAYAATKSAAWSFTNASRVELRESGIHVLGLHLGFMDTDMTRGYDLKKISPEEVAAEALSALEKGQEEVLVDENTKLIKKSLSGALPYYLNVPALA
jgi:NAD(P)-dependent dehydrogenase (short-subunit alcohol dehydrogenase family)